MHARARSHLREPHGSECSIFPVVAALLCGGRLSPMFGGAMVHARLHARDDRIARTAARRRARPHQLLPPKRLGLPAPHPLRTGAPPASPQHACARQCTRRPAVWRPALARPARPLTPSPAPPKRSTRARRPGRGGGRGRERAGGARERANRHAFARRPRRVARSRRCVRGPFGARRARRGRAPADKPGLTPRRPGDRVAQMNLF